jgi:hypothetical protein
LRKTPSNLAGSAAMAFRERSLRLSVFSSTLMQPRVSKACSSIRSFASTFAPVLQREGASQVHPISSPRCSGRSARKRVLPMGSPSGVEGGERALRPGLRVAYGGADPPMKLLSAPGRTVLHPAPDLLFFGGPKEPLFVAPGQRLQTHDLAFQHAHQVLPHAHHPFLGPNTTGSDRSSASLRDMLGQCGPCARSRRRPASRRTRRPPSPSTPSVRWNRLQVSGFGHRGT